MPWCVGEVDVYDSYEQGHWKLYHLVCNCFGAHQVAYLLDTGHYFPGASD